MIGLSTYREQARWGVWDQPADLLPSLYADAVERAGGVPVLLPPQEPTSALEVAARLDGLVVTGGADVDPGRYGAEPHARTISWRTDRDAWEMALLGAADSTGIPVLGICRGMQVMAVQAGGTLDQHLPDTVGREVHSPSGPEFGDVRVSTGEGTRVRLLVGEHAEVACHHHQAVREHPGFVPAAHADDGTLEAMEAPGDRFRVAVQWHPETRSDAGLFAGLVAAALGPPATEEHADGGGESGGEEIDARRAGGRRTTGWRRSRP